MHWVTCTDSMHWQHHTDRPTDLDLIHWLAVLWCGDAVLHDSYIPGDGAELGSCIIIPARFVGEATAPTFYYWLDGIVRSPATATAIYGSLYLVLILCCHFVCCVCDNNRKRQNSNRYSFCSTNKCAVRFKKIAGRCVWAHESRRLPPAGHAWSEFFFLFLSHRHTQRTLSLCVSSRFFYATEMSSIKQLLWTSRLSAYSAFAQSFKEY